MLNKSKLIVFLFTTLLTSSTYSQWTQKGGDIDGTAMNDYLGNSTSVSADAQTILVGSLGNDVNGSNSGRVRVFEWGGTSWTQKGNDIYGDVNEAALGFSVSLSSDGNTFIAGAPNYGKGHVKIYEWNGVSWVQKGNSILGEFSNDYFGERVSMSSDGNSFAAGASGNNGNGADSGHSRVYEWNGTSWVQKGSDIDGENAGDGSGVVSLSSDGDILVIGAILNGDNGINAGHVRVFEWNGAVWLQKGNDVDGSSAGSQFGTAVSVNSSGTSFAVGGDYNDDNGNNSGYVQVYDWDGSAWVQKGNDIQGENSDDWLGRSVFLSSDANTLAVGATGYDYMGANTGQVKILKWNGVSWVQFGNDIYGESAGDRGGRWISLSENANTIAIGAIRNNDNSPLAGQTRVFTCESSSVINESTCGSYTSPSGNHTWNSNGTYYDTIPNVFGCDSTITINLTVNSSSLGVDVHTSCADFTWIDGITYSSSNNLATHTIVGGASSGCDSIITLDLTINSVDISTNVIGATISAVNSNAVYQWINCNGNVSLNGENNQSFSPISNGSYAVILTEGVCVDTSICEIINTIGLDELFATSVNVYPNPTSDILYIETSFDSNQEISIQIIDLLGRVTVKKEFYNSTQIDLNKLEVGTYFVIIETSNFQEIREITVE